MVPVIPSPVPKTLRHEMRWSPLPILWLTILTALGLTHLPGCGGTSDDGTSETSFEVSLVET
ncbi:MAG: hypothetical protein ABGZ17_30710, partial [Planctomycetaceae bacterium]